MRFGLHQRKAINDLIVKSNGLFSVMFLFISSVACDVIDYSCLNSFTWIPQQCCMLVVLFVSDSFPGVGALKGPFFHFFSSSLKTSLRLTRQSQPGSENFCSVRSKHLSLLQVLGHKDKGDWRW